LGYDIIGDIHGHARKLEHLLQIMDYSMHEGVYQHAHRKAVFVGDFIDRGPEQARVLDIVRPMVEQGHALAVMGNHEFNAIAYHSRHPDTGHWLREHSEKNARQHAAFLREFPLGSEEAESAVEWFKTLPLFLDLGDFRVIHACWNRAIIDRLKPSLGAGNTLTEALLLETTDASTQTFDDIEVLLKGPEAGLPEGASFKDKDGNTRHSVRIRWWGPPPETFGEAAFHSAHAPEHIKDIPVDDIGIGLYPVSDTNAIEPPVFFGHYWCNGEPQACAPNVACLDYSAGKGGPLVAYRWPGLKVITGEHFRSTQRG